MKRTPTIARRHFLLAGAGALGLAPISASAAESAAPMAPKIIPPGEGKAVWAMGVHVTLKVISEETGGAYAAFEDIVPPNAGPPPHTHTKEDETMLVLEGELEVTLGEKTQTVKAGTFIHMPRGVPHNFKNRSDKPARMFLTYTPGGFEKWFLEVGTPAADANSPAPKPTPDDLKKAVAAAQTYGVRFGLPAAR
jgi:quercetin dioxygenase-like cupin family protein